MEINVPTSPSHSARLPPNLRASLRAALAEAFGAVPDDLDLDALGFDLLDTMSLLVRLKLSAVHSLDRKDG
jgi:hypothetical protein